VGIKIRPAVHAKEATGLPKRSTKAVQALSSGTFVQHEDDCRSAVRGQRHHQLVNRLRILLVFVAAALVTGGLLVATAQTQTAVQSSPTSATRVDLAAGLPSFAHGYRLSLTRAVIPPGGAFPPHRHPGMQVSYVESGTLQFKVFRGAVNVYRGDANGTQKLVRTIRAGRTGLISRGQWIVENQFLWHQGANVGRNTVVILLATLLGADKPPAIPVTP
jgi:mannose-6-phosphate isomerase-like protein (cupin superfamily)